MKSGLLFASVESMVRSRNRHPIISNLFVASISVLLTLYVQRWLEPRPGLVYAVAPRGYDTIMRPDSIGSFLRKHRDDDWLADDVRGNPTWPRNERGDKVTMLMVHLNSDSVRGYASISAPRAFLDQRVDKVWGIDVRVRNNGERTAERVEVAFSRPPAQWEITPAFPGTSSVVTRDSMFVISVPGVGPKESLYIEAISVNEREPAIKYVSSREGPARKESWF